jgi:hypothetical protein
MEYPRVARARGYAIDVAHYMEKFVLGLCARFINYDAAFQPPAEAKVAADAADEWSQAAAKKHLEKIIKGDNKELRRLLGAAYKRAYKKAAAALEGDGGAVTQALLGDLRYDMYRDDNVDAFDAEARAAAADLAATLVGGGYCAALAARRGAAPAPGDGAAAARRAQAGLDAAEAAARAALAAAAAATTGCARRFEAVLELEVAAHREAELAAAPDLQARVAPAPAAAPRPPLASLFTAAEAAALAATLAAFVRLEAVHLTRACRVAYARYITAAP